MARFVIEAVDPARRTLTVRTNLAPALAGKVRISPPPFLRVGPRLVQLPGPGPGFAYDVRFGRLAPERVVPPAAPRWDGARLCLPLWSITAVPPRATENVEVCAAPGLGLEVLAPPGPLPAAALSGFCLLGGYARRTAPVPGLRVIVHAEDGAALPFLTSLVERVLKAHAQVFPRWVWRELHLVFEAQRPRLRKQKAMLFSHRGFAVGRFVLRSLRPRGRAELATLLDLVEHEVLHYYLDTTAPAGDWMVEGLTTYLSRKLLHAAGILTERDWVTLTREAARDMAANPLAHRITLREAQRRFWDPRYGNVVYAKGFLVSCLLDQDLGGGLLVLGRQLFERVVSTGRQFRPAELRELLPAPERRRLARLLATRDLRAELADVRALVRGVERRAVRPARASTGSAREGGAIKAR